MNYKVSELAEKAGVTKRTIHYYISKGLLLPPKGLGVNSLYNDEHLERLLLIKELQNSYMPLSKIRDYIMENPEASVESLKKKTVNGKNNSKESVWISNDNTINNRNTSNNSNEKSTKELKRSNTYLKNKYIKEDIEGIFEIHISEENYEKYNYVVENVKKYVKKMMED